MDKAPKIISTLFTSTSLRGDKFVVTILENQDGAKWLRIERTSQTSRRWYFDMPLRLCGGIGLALVGYADREAVARDNERAERGQ